MSSEATPPQRRGQSLLWLNQITMADLPLVGGKNASLGEMICNLTGAGVMVPGGFALTTRAFEEFVETEGMEEFIQGELKGLNPDDAADVARRGEAIRRKFLEAQLSPHVERQLIDGYRELGRKLGLRDPSVAVRSSACAEDLKGASFAGAYETILNVKGEDSLLKAVRKCYSSLYTDRAITYRAQKGFPASGNALSVGVQQMVRSDKACSGVIFTMDTESGFDGVVYITSAYGLGELVVQGAVTPDAFYVMKATLGKVPDPIIEKKLGSKKRMLIYTSKGHEEVDVKEEDQNRFSLRDDEVIKLAEWALLIERHYGRPMDIEWAKDGETGNLYIVQARPETVHSAKADNILETYVREGKGKVLAKGEPVGSKIGQGEARVLSSAKEMASFRKGEVLVTDRTDPDWEPIMKIASAIVTNRGGRTCHAAIVSRELGIPCVVGTGDGTKAIQTGQGVTVDCSEGQGLVYEGLLKFRVDRMDLADLPRPKTKVMMNVGVPEHAFSQGRIPCDGVGLARIEFIISSHIGIHPLALVDFEKLKERASSDKDVAAVVTQIEERTKGYEDKAEFFVDKLACGVSKIGAAFYPRDVIVRLSDFKTNEYASLLGGFLYEPKEENPMIGWRGASRYYAEAFRRAFRLECLALKRVRDAKGLTNVKVMVPFCRTPEEGRRVIATMEEFGLKQGENGLEVYVMAEIPSNAILADEFCDVFDGFSIGSNDLTQLTLGLDRDSELVSHLYDERNQAVKKMISMVIGVAKKRGRKIGICGQAPSDFPDFAEFLVECGIDSISLNPDTVLKTRLRVAEKEKSLRAAKGP